MPKREMVAIDRRKLITALNAVEKALVAGDLETALRRLEDVYRLIPPADEQERRGAR